MLPAEAHDSNRISPPLFLGEWGARRRLGGPGVEARKEYFVGTAYTPGLTVSARTRVEKLRRLPLKGAVLVKEGQTVRPDTVVARTELPGLMQTVKVA